jgi:ArsR family transcriptional regulator, arsenate/arsenite/antimonite-responsive transcriptional repressor
MSRQSEMNELEYSVWEQRARLLRIIAHPVRLKILESLCQGPRCVTDINALIEIPQPHLSQHIAALREARLIDRYVNGSLRCYYILKPTLVNKLISLISGDHTERERDREIVIREAQRKRQKPEPSELSSSAP